jgi:PTS system nitrogen regulatory IIA component
MYLNLIQIAESFGVSEGVVETWVREEGMPHTPDRGRLLFDRAQVVEWAAARGLGTRAGFLATESATFATSCHLAPLLRAGGIWRNLSQSHVPDVLSRVVGSLPGASPSVRQLLTQRLRAAGGITWAAVGGGFALPHPAARVALGRDSGVVALLILHDGLAEAEPTPDGVPATRLFFFIAPSPRAHLDLLGRLTRTLAEGAFRASVLKAASDDDILAAAAAADASLAPGAGKEEKE